MEIPRCDIALIGGSSTLTVNIPEELHLDEVTVEAAGLVFATPFGPSPEFKLFTVPNHFSGEKSRIISCRMHGWRKGVSRAAASQQIFWVFQAAGVTRVLAEGGVGAINHLLDPRDLIIPHDYMDFSLRKDVALDSRYLLIMREALCCQLRDLLGVHSRQAWPGRVYNRGIYVNTEGRHFESPAEISLFKTGGADIVGQSLCPEVYLAREIGACYAGLYLVVNYAEGIVAPWQHQELAEIFYSEGYALARILMETIRHIPPERACNCHDLRKETLLKGIY